MRDVIQGTAAGAGCFLTSILGFLTWIAGALAIITLLLLPTDMVTISAPLTWAVVWFVLGLVTRLVAFLAVTIAGRDE